MQGFETFGSGWTQTSKFDQLLVADENYRGWTNYGGTRVWETDRQVMPFFSIMDAAFVDVALWHMSRIGEFSHINGSFYDNFQHYSSDVVPPRSDITGAAYRREDGKLTANSNSLTKHFWNKRFSTAFWLFNRPPWQVGSNEQDNTFASNWFVEGVLYIRNRGLDWIDQGMTPEAFRAFTARTSPMAVGSSQLPYELNAEGRPVGVDQNAARIVLATGLLHDVGITLGYLDPFALNEKNSHGQVIRHLDEMVRFFDGAELLRYWKQETGLAGIPEGVYVGGYRSPDQSAVVLVILNTTKAPIDTEIRWGAVAPLNGPASQVTDVETGSLIPATPKGFQLQLPGRGVRYLLVRKIP
jgi:hypothetical protein